jgi:hypothetical protein
VPSHPVMATALADRVDLSEVLIKHGIYNISGVV